MGDVLSLVIGTKLDTKEAEQALNKFVRKSQNTKIIDLGNGATQFRDLITYIDKAGNSYQRLVTSIKNADGTWTQLNNKIVGIKTKFNEINEATVNTSKDIVKIKNSTGELVTTITQVNELGEKIVTTIKEYDNGLGRITKNTKVYNETQQKTISMNQESIDNQVKVNAELEKQNQLKTQLTKTTQMSEETIQREGNSYKALVTTIKEQTHEYGEVTTTITKYTDKLGNTVVETQKLDSEGKALAQTTKTVTQEMERADTSTKNLGKAAQDTANKAKSLGQSFSDIVTKVTKFYLATLPIRAVQTAITETVQTLKEFDSALIEFRKVSDLAGESLTEYVAKLAEMGEVTGSTMQAMVEAATEFRKSGFSDEDSAKLASIAEKYRNIADEEISAGESASFIIAQMKAFNIEAGQAEHIIDAVYL